ncbi:hypothetical protein [Paraburkholderia gardini]|uniref:Uncharacterized protein n=1 Tax=Paraburkholderia gardini TaxID=2823469 RepID=A0ABN7QJN1_9BURK|nr:hypothetical protein [Paraburkholderia gardini]CAG4889712.1 hypothetical protein R54767_00801 [Paraburkholderia gardini]
MMPEQQKNETTYLFRTGGWRTERGGSATQACSRLTVDGLNLARVGEKATREVGSKAVVIDGPVSSATCITGLLAQVGSRLSNDETIAQTLQDSHDISVRDGELFPGLFEPVYMPSLNTDVDRGPNHA